MRTVLLWSHVALMMVAFGASPLGRLGLRYLLSRTPQPYFAVSTIESFKIIFLLGGITVTAGVCAGLVLGWDGGFSQLWLAASIALIVIAGLGGVTIEDRWLRRLGRAKDDSFTAILHERTPLLAALVSPVLWLCILWLMIAKPT